MSNIKIPKHPLINGRLIHRRVDCDCGIWLYPINCPNPADYLHFRDHSKEHSEGYGGRVIPFLLEDGTTIELQGPWHGNAHSMYTDCGVDLRDKHYTFGWISKKRQLDRTNFYEFIYEDILYQDNQWVLGRYERIKNRAEEFKNDLGLNQIYYFNQSLSGSVSSCI